METRSLLDLIHRVNQRGNAHFAELHSSDVTPRQIAILRALQANQGTSQTGLVHATGIDRSTIAEIVKRLTQRGLLKRRRSKRDARAYVVNLSPEGELLLAEAEPVIATVEKAMLESLPEEERETFVSALQRLAIAR
jgi:MarR family transcriptional regulator, temperature-dependent positive regulator of motility